MTSRSTNGRISAELPISRRSSMHAIAVLRSSGCDRALASIRMGSDGSGPDNRTRPRLLGWVGDPKRHQLFSGRPNLAIFSGVDFGKGPRHANRSGPSTPAAPESQKRVEPTWVLPGP